MPSENLPQHFGQGQYAVTRIGTVCHWRAWFEFGSELSVLVTAGSSADKRGVVLAPARLISPPRRQMIAMGRANARTMCSFRKRPRNLLTADFFNKHPLRI